MDKEGLEAIMRNLPNFLDSLKPNKDIEQISTLQLVGKVISFLKKEVDSTDYTADNKIMISKYLESKLIENNSFVDHLISEIKKRNVDKQFNK